MKLNIGLTGAQLQQSIDILAVLLADEYLLYTKTRHYHWNVTGVSFYELHKFFEEQYSQLEEIFDEVAERTRYLGGVAHGSMAAFLKNTRLTEDTENRFEFQVMIDNLTKDHETTIRNLREAAQKAEENGDMGTNDFLIGTMQKHEKMAWMLHSFNEKM